MARSLQFRHGEAVIAFEVGAKVDKKALYGYAKRIAEKDGKALSRGLLMADGRLLPTSAVSYVRVDPLGSPVEPVVQQQEGQPVELKPSSFDVELPLEPVSMARLAEFQVSDVYPLAGEGLAAGLYRTEFNFRKSPQAKDALLLVRGAEAFLLVGVARRSTFLELSVAYDFFDAAAEAEDADELDFSMV